MHTPDTIRMLDDDLHLLRRWGLSETARTAFEAEVEHQMTLLGDEELEPESRYIRASVRAYDRLRPVIFSLR